MKYNVFGALTSKRKSRLTSAIFGLGIASPFFIAIPVFFDGLTIIANCPIIICGESGNSVQLTKGATLILYDAHLSRSSQPLLFILQSSHKYPLSPIRVDADALK